MPGHELALEMIAAAKSDLKALKHMLDPDAFDDRVFGFHAQQAIEKALNAWLNVVRQSHPFTHDLSFLLNALKETGANVEPYWDFLDLSEYGVRFRYETLPQGEEPLERCQLLRDVGALIGRVEGLLSPT